MKNLFFTFAFLLIGTLSFAKSANVKVLSQTLKNGPTGPKSSTSKVAIYCNGKLRAYISCDSCTAADYVAYALDICG